MPRGQPLSENSAEGLAILAARGEAPLGGGAAAAAAAGGEGAAAPSTTAAAYSMPNIGVERADGYLVPVGGAGQAAAAPVDKSDPSCRPKKAQKATAGQPGRPQGTKARPSQATQRSWLSAHPYQEGAETNLNGKRAGGPGDLVFEPHPRSTWLSIEARASNTQEWNDVIAETGALFGKDMPATRPQLRVRPPSPVPALSRLTGRCPRQAICKVVQPAEQPHWGEPAGRRRLQRQQEQAVRVHRRASAQVGRRERPLEVRGVVHLEALGAARDPPW